MTVKKQIYNALKPLGYPLAYASTPEGFPAIRYTLVSNVPRRLSNEKASRRVYYQIDVFSQAPIDVEAEGTVLSKVEAALEDAGLYTNNWTETLDLSNETQFAIYRYLIEVRN